MEKNSEASAVSTRTIDEYRESTNKEKFIQEILRDQETLRQELKNLLDDVNLYKKRTGKMIDALVVENVNLKKKLAKMVKEEA